MGGTYPSDNVFPKCSYFDYLIVKFIGIAFSSLTRMHWATVTACDDALCCFNKGFQKAMHDGLKLIGVGS